MLVMTKRGMAYGMTSNLVFFSKVQSVVDDSGHSLIVPGVDHHGATKTSCSACELAQDERTMVLLLAHDVLERGRVHAISDRRDQTNISDRQQGVVLVTVNMLVVVVHGSKVERAICTINVGNQLGNLGFQLSVLDQRRRRDLDHDNLSLHLGVVVQELFKRLEFLLNTLGQIELVATDNDALALIGLAYGFHLGENTRSLALALDTLGINTNGESADPHG